MRALVAHGLLAIYTCAYKNSRCAYLQWEKALIARRSTFADGTEARLALAVAVPPVPLVAVEVHLSTTAALGLVVDHKPKRLFTAAEVFSPKVDLLIAVGGDGQLRLLLSMQARATSMPRWARKSVWLNYAVLMAA